MSLCYIGFLFFLWKKYFYVFVSQSSFSLQNLPAQTAKKEFYLRTPILNNAYFLNNHSLLQLFFFISNTKVVRVAVLEFFM